ncbi:MAG: TIGR03862 family flavoprotein [Vicingaceae bacterium]
MKKKISIIGGGAAAIATAAFLDHQKFEVSIFEKNKALGRKFLVAGKGGFNLTHAEHINLLLERYTPSAFLKEHLLQFSNEDLRNWLETIGIPTYVGSSKRVYPQKGIKPIEVLQAIQAVLSQKDVNIIYNKTWTGWDKDKHLIFNENEVVASDYVVFALGGGSWKVTGSDGIWLSLFKKRGIKVASFEPSNCAYQIKWKADFIQKYAGTPLKNISISCLNKEQKGEVVITSFGLEGNAIYALSPELRTTLNKQQKAIIYIDFKPSLSLKDVLTKLNKSKVNNITKCLKSDLKLSNAQIALLKIHLTKEEFLNNETLAEKIKGLQLEVSDIAELDEAISTVGGICLSKIDSHFEFKGLKNSFCIGEMLDWDAPTGGYLLQACFSMGFSLSAHLNKKG